MPVPSDEDYAKGVRWGQRHCNEHGITGVLDASVNERHMRVYHAWRGGRITVRICATARVDPEETADAALARVEGLRRAYRSPMLRVHSAKFFLDGIFENRTAAMIEDYSDAIGGNAPVMFGENHLRDLFIRFDAARFQIHAHVIGDKAARAGLDALEAARDINGAWPSLHQLAHVQSHRPCRYSALSRIGRRREYSAALGAERAVGHRRNDADGRVRTHALDLCLQITARCRSAVHLEQRLGRIDAQSVSDYRNRRHPPAAGQGTGHPAFIPEERIGLADCIRGYTVNAAAAAWRSEDTGSLAVGKFGDLIMLDRDIFAIDTYDIGDTKVLLTLLGGREVYRREGW